MTNKRSTKRALLTSIMAMVLCVAMLAGTTFAWFTDSVTSSGNKIMSGSLKVDLELLDKENGTWTSIKDTSKAIFDYDKWEPGYTDVKILKVVNEGTLALKWKAMFVSDVELSKLADVIDVYVNTTVTEYPTDRTAIESWKKVGTVRDFVNTIETTTTGTLEAGKDAYLGIALKMQETAGNEYQSLDLGGAFDIRIVATQDTVESDSFDANYDEKADYPGEVSTALALKSALENGESVKLVADITADETIEVPADAEVVIDLNGKTLSSGEALTEDAEPVIFNRGTLSVKNGTINAVDTTAIRNHGTNAVLTLDDMTITQEAAVDPEWQGTAVITSGGATAVINSGNYSGVSSAAIVATTGGHLIINGGTFTADATTIRIDSWSNNSFLTINDGTFNVSKEGAKALYVDGYEEDININGGTFNGTIDSTYTAININGGTFTKSIKQSGGHQNYYNINGGTFVDDLSVSISNNTKVNGTVTDNGNGTYTVAITAEDFLKGLAANAGGNITLGNNTVDMGGETVAIAHGTTISGGTIENVTLTVADTDTDVDTDADKYAVSFEGVNFDDEVIIQAQGDGKLVFTDCEFNVNPSKVFGFSRGSAIIGANQYYTIDLELEGCTFNYQYESGDADRWNNAIFMWSNVKNVSIKNCTFNDYGFVAVKLMNVAEGAEIVFEGNTFNMSKQGAVNWYNNNAIQIVPQHDNAFTAKFINNTFNGDYEDGKIAIWIDGMSNLNLTNYTIEHSGNTINGEALTNENFAINP